MALARTPRGDWIEEGLRALAAGGPRAVRIETLAHSLGVSKGGFYGYFANRDALLTEMLDTWEQEVTEAVIEHVEGGGGDGRAKLARLYAMVSTLDTSPIGLMTELAVRDWARHDSCVAERLRRVDNRQMGYLRSLFASFCPDPNDVEARCMLAVSLRIGNHLVVAEHGGLSRSEVMAFAKELVLRPPATPRVSRPTRH